jgi:hypothetical protein
MPDAARLLAAHQSQLRTALDPPPTRYRSTVAHRANLAAARGFRYLETDASSDSRPILERFGFTSVTTAPYVWSP